MKKIKLMAISLVVVFLAASAINARAEGPQEKWGREHKGHIAEELNLTPDQQAKIEQNRKAQREEAKKLYLELRAKQGGLREELKKPAATKASVAPLVNDIKSLQAKLTDQRVNAIFAVKEILTPEQFAKFQEMTEKRLNEKKGRFYNWREKRKCGNRG